MANTGGTRQIKPFDVGKKIETLFKRCSVDLLLLTGCTLKTLNSFFGICRDIKKYIVRHSTGSVRVMILTEQGKLKEG